MKTFAGKTPGGLLSRKNFFQPPWPVVGAMKDVEIDLLAYDTEGKDILFGECKYSTQKKGMEVLRDLQQRQRAFLGTETQEESPIFFIPGAVLQKNWREYAEHQPNLYLRKLV